MATTDTRIIEMQFENQQFEKNIAKSTKSVEDLKAAMDFEQTSSGLSKFASTLSSLDFSRLTDNVQKLTDKFTGLGTLSELVMSQIRRGIEQAAAKVSSFVSSMTTNQIAEGKGKYEMLNKSVQTIMAATGKGEQEVYDVLSRLNEYTDQTSYNFSDMVSNIGKFTSVGIDLQSAEQQMEGIANWAARSGAGITEASRAMYNLSQAMGVGKLTKIDWKSIENAGMATKEFKEQLIQAGLAAGTLTKDSNGTIKTAKSLGKQMEVSYNNLSETLSKGWATKDVLGNTLLGYYYDDLYYEGKSTAQKLSDDQKKIFDQVFSDASTITKEGWKKLQDDGTSETLDKTAESAKNLTKELTAVNEQGERYGRRNIDLNKRKIVKNDDGSISTEFSFSVEIDGKQVLLPTVIDGKIVNEDEAIKHFEETGEHLGMFDTIKEAEEYAQRLHEVQALYYNNIKSFEGIEELNDALGEQALVSDETKQKLLDVAVEQGNLTKKVSKDGKTVYTTTDKVGKNVTFTMDKLEESLDSGWLTRDIAKMVWGFDTLAEDAYKAAQKCTTFTDVLQAWKDQLSTGWMTTYRLLFGDLSESMEFFSNVCNKVGDALGELVDFRNSILKSWSTAGGRNSLFEILLGSYGDDVESDTYGLIDIILDCGNLIKDAFWDFVQLFIPENLRKIWNNETFISTGGRESFLGGMLKNFTDSVEKFFQGIRNFFNEEIDVGGESKSRLDVIRDVIKGIVGALKLGWDILVGMVYFATMIGQDLAPGINSVLGFISALGLSIYETADEAGKGNKVIAFFTEMRDIAQPLTDSINSLLLSLTNLLRIIFGLDEKGATQTETLGKIADFIKTLFDIVVKVASPIITFLSRIIDLISDLVKNGISNETLQNFGRGLGEGFSEMMTSFADALPEGFLRDWIRSVFGGGKKQLEQETNSLFGLIGKVTKKSDQTTKKAQQNQNQTGGGLMGLMTGSNVAVWVGVAALASVVLLLRKARKTVGEVGDFIGNLGDTLKNGFKVKFQDESFANKFLKIGAAIALVAASIVALGSIPLESLVQGGIAVLAVTGIMFALFKILQSTTAKDGFKNQMAFAAQVTALAFSMMAFGVAIGILALALVPFSMMSWEGYARAMAGLGGVLVEILAFMELFKLLGLSTKALNITGIAMFAIGIGLIVQGITPFANMTWDQYAKVMAGLGGVLVEILAFMEIFKLLSLSTKALKFDGIAKFAIAIGILIFALKPFASMTWDQYARVMAGLGGVLLEILAFMELFKLLGLSTKALNFNGIVKFTLALAILVFAIKPFASMSWDQYARVMAGLGGILVEILAFMELFKLLGLSTKALNIDGIVKFTLAIAILIFAIKPFADMTWDQYARAMAGLGGVLLEIIAFMALFKLLGLSTKALDFAGILVFAFGIKILIDSLQPFTQMNPQQYQQAILGLMSVLVLLAGFMGITKLLNVSSLNIAAIMPFAYGISTLINAIVPFASMQPQEIANAIIGLIDVLAVMLSFMVLMKMVKPGIKAMLEMAIFAGIFAAVAGTFAVVLGLVKDIDWKVIAAFGVGLAALIAAIGIGAAIASAVGIYGMAILAAGIILVLGAVALMIPILLSSISSGMRDAAANMAIVGDLMASFTDKTSGIDEGEYDKAERIVNKMTSLISTMAAIIFTGSSTRVFMNCMSQLTLAVAELVKLDNKIKLLSADAGIGKLTGIVLDLEHLFTENLSKFEEYITYAGHFYSVLYKLGSGIDYFQSMTNDLPSAEDNPGLQLIKELAACAPNLDTIYKMDLDKFRRQLSLLGGAMIIYAEGAASVDGGTITEDTDISGAITLLHKISDSLAKDGGFTIPENMPTGDALTDFGDQLAALAGALVAFEKAGAGLGSGTEQALATLDFFADLKERLLLMPGFGTGLGTAINAFKDENGNFIQKDELATFGEDIAQLGSSMKYFAEATQYTDEETGEVKAIDFTKATEALGAIVDLQNKLPEFGGVLQVFTGTREDLGTLSGDINLLGTAISEFYSSTTTVVDGVPKPMDFGTNNTGVLGFLNSIADIQGRLPRVKSFSLASLFYDPKMSFGELGSQLVSLGSGLKLMSDAITGTNPETKKKNFDIDAATTAADYLTNKIVPLMETLARDLPTVGGLWNTINNIVGTGHEFTLKDLSGQLSELGNGLGALGEGLSKGSWGDNDAVQNAFDSLDSILGLMIHLQSFYTTLQNDPMSGGTAQSAFANLSDFLDWLVADGEVVNGREVFPIAEKISSFIQAVDNSLTDWLDGDDTLFENALTRMEMFKTFTEGLNALTTSNLTADWKFIGNKLTTDVAASISEGTSSVSNALQTMMTATYTSAGNVPGVVWSVLGTNIALGVETGVKTAGPTHVTPAVRQMMVDAYNAGKQAIKSNSPSKLFMELGNYMGEGTAIGLKKSTDDVGENAGLMGEVALDKARDMVALISAVMAEDTNASPTISPILDLTNLEAGMAQFKAGLTGYNVNLDTSGAVNRAGNVNTAASAQTATQTTVDLTGIYTRMEQMNTKIASLGTAISQMKLVLDSGVIVGEVSSSVDAYLGRNKFYANRRN